MSVHADSRKKQWRELAKHGSRDEIAGFVGKLLVCLDQAENERDAAYGKLIALDLAKEVQP